MKMCWGGGGADKWDDSGDDANGSEMVVGLMNAGRLSVAQPASVLCTWEESMSAFFLFLAPLAVVLMRWPVVGLYVVAGCAVLIEQEPLFVPIGTDRLNVYNWPPALEGLFERPIGFLFIAILLLISCRRCLYYRQKPLCGGKLFLALMLYLLCVMIGIVHGLASGGNLKIITIEVRPFWYLFVAYMIAYNLVATRRHVSLLLWLIIVAGGIKALQGMYIYFIVLHSNLSGHHEIMAHEESFFFVGLLLLTILFCMHRRVARAQFFSLLIIMPCVLIALVANQRRTDYLALLIGGLVVWTLTFYFSSLRARLYLALGLCICTFLVGGYIALCSQLSGPFAEPAHAIISIFHPEATDTLSVDSDTYRRIENYDLQYTAMKSPVFGWGFGKPFLQPLVLPNISSLDANYLYIPHNTIYWIWMRLGILGFAALCYFFVSIAVYGCLIANQLKDPYLRLVAIYIIAVTFIEVIVAYADYQLFAYRNVIFLGILAGVLLKLPVLVDKKSSAHNLRGALH